MRTREQVRDDAAQAASKVKELMEAGQKITLNGADATISGYKNDFASVRDYKTHLGQDWAWETVLHIITNRSGKFESV